MPDFGSMLFLFFRNYIFRISVNNNHVKTKFEDRLAKKSFKALQKQGVYSEVAKDVIRPSAEECNTNPRARSTKMRWAIKA